MSLRPRRPAPYASFMTTWGIVVLASVFVVLTGCASGPLAFSVRQATGQTTAETHGVKLMSAVYGANLNRSDDLITKSTIWDLARQP